MAPQVPERFLPYGRQSIDEADIAAVSSVLRGNYLTTGPAVAAFEAAFSGRLGVRYSVACSSGTAALHLAALALGLGPGDKVVVPSVTFLATVNAVRYVGADVVFADIDPETGLMTVDTLKAAVAKAGASNSVSVFPVHLNGQTCDMAQIKNYCDAQEYSIVEDACHALGGDGVGACQYSDMAIFSLHPVKAIAAGEGGVVTTNDPELAGRLERFRNHGMVRDAASFQDLDQAFDKNGDLNPWYYEMPELGFNYRLSDIHAALASSQLEKLDQFIDRCRSIAKLYDQAIRHLAPVAMPVSRVPGPPAAWHLYVVLIDFEKAGKSRREVMEILREADVGTQVHYYPVHRQPYYKSLYPDVDLPGADNYYAHALSLPLFPAMQDSDVDHVVESLAAAIG